MKCAIRFLCLTLAVTVSGRFLPPAQADTSSWNSAVGGSFTDGTKWNNGVPMSDDTAMFNRNLNVQYNVTFPGRQTALESPVYEIDQLRVGTNTVSFADFTDFGLLTPKRVVVLNSSADAIIIGETVGQMAVLNTRLRNFESSGATIGNSVLSSGTLNVNAGTFTLSGDIDPDDDLIIGNRGTGTLNVMGGGTVNGLNSNAVLGKDFSSSGAATVNGAGSFWSHDRLTVGDLGTGTLNITNGGLVSGFTARIGVGGTAFVDGANSRWSPTLSLAVRAGALSITNGGHVDGSTIYVGTSPGSGGSVLVDGPGSTLDFGNFIVGNDSAGSMTITGGGHVSALDGFLGYTTGSSGAVTVDGANSELVADLYVGYSNGNGTLTVTNGGHVSGADFDIQYIGFGVGSSGIVTIDGANSQWTNNGGLTVGYIGDSGTLHITNGGRVSNTFGYIGYDSFSTGLVTVDGAGSTWTNSGDLTIGDAGRGTLTVSDGGAVSVDGLLSVGSRGSVKGNGNIAADMTNAGVVAPGNSAGALHIDGAYIQAAAGTLQIELGGTTPGTNYDQLLVNGAVSLNGTLHVSLLNPFSPTLPGQSFTIVTAGSLAGTFDTLIGQPSATLPGLFWTVSYTDSSVLLSTSALPGDIDLDGDVDRTDAALFSQFFGTTSDSIWTTGDFNGDAATTLADFGLLQSHLGMSVPSPAVATAVPEPSTLSLLALAVVVIMPIFQFRRKRGISFPASYVRPVRAL